MTTLDSLLPANNCDTRTINVQSEGVRRAIEINIQLLILQTLQGIQAELSGGGAPTLTDAINYPGPPAVNPPNILSIVVDVNGRQWQYFGGTWN